MTYLRERKIEKEFEKLIPDLVVGMSMYDSLELILLELKRLKKIEAKYLRRKK